MRLPKHAVIVSLLAGLSLAPEQATAQYPYPDRTQRTIVRGSERIASAAHRLSESATKLYYVLRNNTGFSHITDDALQLARRAERFHRLVERGTTPHILDRNMRELQREYVHMRQMLQRAHGAHHASAIVDTWSDVAAELEKLSLVSGVDADLCAVPTTYSYRDYHH